MSKREKQSITQDIEMKNNPSIAKVEWALTVGRRVFRNYNKGHMDQTKGEDGSKGRRWDWLGSGGIMKDKCRQL